MTTDVTDVNGYHILPRCLSEIEVEDVAFFQFDSNFSDQVASGTDMRASGYEDFEGVSKLISHARML